MAAKTTSEGLSQEERDAVKQRAKELREQEKAGKNREAGLQSVLTAISALNDDDRALAEGLHKVVSEVAPDLVPKTYYGMPGYANSEGKIVVFIQPAGSSRRAIRPSASRTGRNSTTATCGRPRSHCATGPPRWRRGCGSSSRRRSAEPAVAVAAVGPAKYAVRG